MNKIFTLIAFKNSQCSLKHNEDFQSFEVNETTYFLKNFTKNPDSSKYYNFFGNLYNQIGNEEEIGKEQFSLNPEKYLSKAKGKFSSISFDKDSGECKVVTDILGTLPIYFYKIENCFVITNNIFSIIKYLGKIEIDNDSLTNFLIFNYHFFENTIFKNTKQLSKCKIYKIDDKFQLKSYEYFNLSSLTKQDIRKTNDTNVLKLNLVDIMQSYKISESTSSLALTNGFDSRLALSALLNQKIPVQSFTFGNEGSNVFQRVKEISKITKIGNNFYPVTDSFKENFGDFWKEVFLTSNGNFSIYRLLRVWAIQQELSKVENLIFGFVGGEFIRGLMVDKLMFSESISAIILNDRELFQNSSNLKLQKIFLKSDFLETQKSYVENLFDKLQNPYSTFDSKERLFNVTIEVFGKHFGTDIFLCMQKGNVLTPYLDIDFLKEVLTLKDNLITVEPFSKSFIQKFRSHAFYCELISKLQKSLLTIELDRGYKPEDILNKQYFKIIKNYYLKKKSAANSIPDYSMGEWFKNELVKNLEEVKPLLKDIFDFDKVFDSLATKNQGSNLTFLPYTQILNLGFYYKANEDLNSFFDEQCLNQI